MWHKAAILPVLQKTDPHVSLADVTCVPGVGHVTLACVLRFGSYLSFCPRPCKNMCSSACPVTATKLLVRFSRSCQVLFSVGSKFYVIDYDIGSIDYKFYSRLFSPQKYNSYSQIRDLTICELLVSMKWLVLLGFSFYIFSCFYLFQNPDWWPFAFFKSLYGTSEHWARGSECQEIWCQMHKIYIHKYNI